MSKKSSKSSRVVVHLRCTSCVNNGKVGVSRYSVYKNKKNTMNRLELKKYCSFERKHMLYREI